MTILRIKDIQKFSSQEKKEKIRELRTELFRLRTMIKAGGTVENPARLSELRKTIAQIITIDHERISTKKVKKQETRRK